MYKKKSLLIVFEGIEGSGKTYHSRKLFLNLKKKGFPTIYTREPGGITSSEAIRKLILTGKKKKFDKLTDSLLYLAARNEHFKKKIYPALQKKKIIICDRFIDSSLAYQVFGYGINKSIVDLVHKEILNNFKPDLTFVLKIDIKTAIKRIHKRKVLNRYDKLSKSFYSKVQKAFIKIAKQNKRKYVVLNSQKNATILEDLIFSKVFSLLK